MGDTFSPAEWLASMEKVGGAYALTGKRLRLWVVSGDLGLDDLAQARIRGVELTGQQCATVIEPLRSSAMVV